MSEWCSPTQLPDLRRHAGLIALDTETKDDRLRAELGSGWPFADGQICGLSVAYHTGEGVRGSYFPMRHPDSENFDPEQIYQWLRDHVAAGARFLTQNGLYDWGWLRAEAGIRMPPGERIEEIGALATLVDENRHRYGLESLCAWRGISGKDDALLRQGIEALSLHTNKRKKLRPQAYIWQLPARYVGPYAEADAVSTLGLFDSLDPVLDQEGTRAAYRLECDLLPMVQEMRWRGIRVDLDAAERARDLLMSRRDAILGELSARLSECVGMHELDRNKWLAATFDRHGIKYPLTEKGNPSFTSGQIGWMGKHAHWLPQLITKANRYHKAGADFVETDILGHVVKGRIHAEIHPHRAEDNGTKSFRFAYSSPPLQQMPSRDPELAPLIRGVFLPEEGEVWAKPDASQQEFRLVVHYANQHQLPKAAETVERYRDDPDADFHSLAATITGLARNDAKAVNFAKIYGAGVKKFADMIGKPLEEAQRIFTRYDRELPFLRLLSGIYTGQAKRTGTITLYDGARRHFDKFAPGGKWQKGAGPCELDEARLRLADPEHPWFRRGPLYRADTRNALNALIQGSAARHTKLWMRAVWREGIVPLLQMHDCLDCSVSSLAQAELVARLGCEAVTLNVPMRVDVKFGRSWGDATHNWDESQGTPASSAKAGTSAPAPPQPAPEAPPPPLPTPAASSRPRASTTSSRTGINGRAVDFSTESDFALASDFTIPVPALKDMIGEPLVNGKICCPFHDDTTPSLHIYSDHYHCFVCGAHGDANDWLCGVEGLSEEEAAAVLANWEGPIAAPGELGESEAKTLDCAGRLWQQGVPIAGTPALRYLARVRRIDIEALPETIDQVLRFHPRCLFGQGVTRPCLMALYRDVETDAEAGIHRIAVTPEVLKGAKVERRTLGRWPAPRAIKLWPASSQLFLGEGLETVLAAGTRLEHRGTPMRPAWAAGSTSNMSRFPVVTGIDRLILLVDHDEAGEMASAACHGRWRAAGRETVRLRPQAPGSDFNDLVITKLKAGAS